MELKLKLQQMLQILEDAERAGAMSDLEKDMILSDLREVYSEIKFGAVLGEKQAAKDEIATPAFSTSESEEGDEPEMEVEILLAEEDDVEAEPTAEAETEEPADEPSITPVVAPLAAAAATAAVAEAAATEVAAESATPIVDTAADAVCGATNELITPEATPEATPEPTPEATPEPAIEEAVAEGFVAEPTVEEVAPVADDDLSIVNSQLSVNKPHRNVILSLYDEAPTVIGEQFRETTSVADMIASSTKETPSIAPIGSLNDAINVADKFMLVQSLFNGDEAAYESAIVALDSMPSFDDCVIFISENYVWSPNDEGTKYMMKLLQRKYNA